jgi:hypothetical protein
LRRFDERQIFCLIEKQTKLEAVKKALREQVLHKKQLEILEFFGKIEFDANWDYKTERQKA